MAIGFKRTYVSIFGASMKMTNVKLNRELTDLSELISRGGGGYSLNWTKRVYAAQQGVVFRVLRLKQGIQFQYLAS